MRLTVVSKAGKEATIAILNPSDFFGEGGLAGQNRRIGSAEAMEDSELMRIQKGAMLLAVHRENKLSDMFVTHVAAQQIDNERALVTIAGNVRATATVLAVLVETKLRGGEGQNPARPKKPV